MRHLKRFALSLTALTVAVGTILSGGAAQARDYTMTVPSGVPDGSQLVLFGEGWGQQFPVQGGRVTIPGDIDSSSVYGNIKLPSGDWFEVENLNSVPNTWGAYIQNGNCFGGQEECNAIGSFVSSGDGTFALVAPIAGESQVSFNTVSQSGGTVVFTPPAPTNSSNWAGVRDRATYGLSTGGPAGLINWGQILSEGNVPAVAYVQNGQIQAVRMTRQGTSYTAQIPAGSEFQIVMIAPDNRIEMWMTVGAAVVSGADVNDGTGQTVLGPYTLTAR